MPTNQSEHPSIHPCGYSGERISRHNMLRYAIFEVAAAAALNPVKEGRFLLQTVALQMCSSGLIGRRLRRTKSPLGSSGTKGYKDPTVSKLYITRKTSETVCPFQDRHTVCYSPLISKMFKHRRIETELNYFYFLQTTF